MARRWPGRIIRSGPHAVRPSGEEPRADRVIGAGDTVTAHFGPLLGGHGTNFTRTVVLGDDPARLRLRADLPAIFAAGRAVFHANSRITGRQLYEFACDRLRLGGEQQSVDHPVRARRPGVGGRGCGRAGLPRRPGTTGAAATLGVRWCPAIQ